MKMKNAAFKFFKILLLGIDHCEFTKGIIIKLVKLLEAVNINTNSPRLWPHWASLLVILRGEGKTRLGRNKTMLFQLDKARHFYGEWFEQHQSKNVKQKISRNHKDISSQFSTKVFTLILNHLQYLSNSNFCKN